MLDKMSQLGIKLEDCAKVNCGEDYSEDQCACIKVHFPQDPEDIDFGPQWPPKADVK
jgi:hypothetical protein